VLVVVNLGKASLRTKASLPTGLGARPLPTLSVAVWWRLTGVSIPIDARGAAARLRGLGCTTRRATITEAEAGGINLYWYAANAPLNRFDPFGLEAPAPEFALFTTADSA
jgi:hypothetical protein